MGHSTRRGLNVPVRRVHSEQEQARSLGLQNQRNAWGSHLLMCVWRGVPRSLKQWGWGALRLGSGPSGEGGVDREGRREQGVPVRVGRLPAQAGTVVGSSLQVAEYRFVGLA